MSSVSVTFTGSQPRIGLCPDPNQPPVLLENIADVPLPTTTVLSQADGSRSAPMPVDTLLRMYELRVKNEGRMATLPSKQRGPDFSPDHAQRETLSYKAEDLLMAFAEYLVDLVRVLGDSVEVEVAALGKVDHLILVPPPRLTQAARHGMAELTELYENLNMDIVPYYAAVMNHHGKGEIKSTPFVAVQWDNELRVGRRSFPDRSPEGMAILGKDRCLPSARWATMREQVSDWLVANWDSKRKGDAKPANSRPARRCRPSTNRVADELLQQALLGREKATLTLDEGQTVEVGNEELEEIRAMLSIGPGNFLRTVLNRLPNADNREPLVSSGDMLRWPLCKETLKQTAQETKFDCLDTDGDGTAALGALRMVDTPPVVPYDCGVLVRPAHEKAGVGTLVLLRGSPADTVAKSRFFRLPQKRSRDVEVLFYTRQVDFDNQRIEYRFAQKQIRFAPEHDDKEKTQFYVTMKLNSNNDGRITSVKTTLHDELTGKTYPFPSLPFTGGVPDLAKIRRSGAGEDSEDARELKEELAAIKNSQADWSVKRWRQALSPAPPPPPPRISYLFTVFGMEGLSSDLELLLSDSPETVQTKARAFVHGQMTRLARGIDGTNVRAWCKRFPEPDRKEAMANEFKNAVYQDAVGEDEKLETAANLAHHFQLACAAPRSLRVDWDNREMPEVEEGGSQ